MLLSQFRDRDHQRLMTMNRSTLVLLILLQMALWYPCLTEAFGEADRQTKLAYRAEHDWQRQQQQARRLQNVSFSGLEWLHIQVVDMKKNIPIQWEVSGSASLRVWQTTLERIETQFELVLLSASWWREANSDWSGRLRFRLGTPKKNPAFHDWLPINIQKNRFQVHDWQVLSTVRKDDKASALLLYKHSQFWVKEDSWLPSVGLTVNDVSLDQIILIANDGTKQTLAVRQQEAQ